MFTTSSPYSSKLSLIQYNDNLFRVILKKYCREKGWELFESDNMFSKCDCDLDEIQRVSLTRSKSKIRELALCNNFEYFGTLTINGFAIDRYCLDDCQFELKKILKKIKRNNKDFKYLIITEKHKDNAFHFHGLFSGLDLSLNEFGYFYNEELSKLGYNSFSLIRDYNKTCNYILKYITKDCVRNSHNQIYISSRKLKSATDINIDIDLEQYIDFNFENEFCKIKDLDLTKLSDNDKLFITKFLFTQNQSFVQFERGVENGQ